MEIQFYKAQGLCALVSSFVKRFQKKAAHSISILTGLLLICVAGYSQSTSLSFTQIPVSDPDINRPGGGAEQWTAGQNIVNIPVQGTNTPRLDAYYRFQWIDIQPSNASGAGAGMSWSNFDAQVNDAISKGQGFSFGVMPNCCTGPTVGGAGLVYPQALHNAMQAESVKDWNNGGGWYENPNSPTWLAWFKALHQAIYNHIQTTSYNGVPYKNVVKRIDVRIAGDFGEQAVLNSGPSGTAPTSASLKSLVDAVVQSYPTIKCVALIGAFANGVYGFTPADVGYYELTTSNQAGVLGWRWDSWGWTDAIYHNVLENNKNVYNGYRFDTAIMNRYKYAPVCGEPADLGYASNNFADLPVRVNQYHAESFGNGNLDVNNPPNSTIQNNFRAASKAAGYRLILTGGSMTTTLSAGGSFNLALNWQNIGLAPSYENWNITYELRNSSGTVAWTGTSAFVLRLFSPTGSAQAASDNFTLPSTVPQGTYSMYLIIKDPNGYRKPLPLAITGVNSDGSYLLRSNITVGTGGTANKLPTANAGSDQTIQLPTATATLSGSGTDTDGTIASYAWTKKSGPTTGTITSPAKAGTTLTGLVQGVYVFTLTVTDNQGGTGTDDVQITVNAASSNSVPVANAGSDMTITLPTSSVTVNGGSSSDANGTITSYTWTKVGGPSQYTIASSTSVSTSITNLTSGVYSFQLKVMDNAGATAMDTVKVTVNAAAPANQPPVAKAGNDQTITLPTNSVNISGSASSDPDGTISSYLWTKLTGPSQYTLGNANSVSTTVSNLASGVYTFQLKVTDNSGAIAQDTIKIIVNAAPVNQPPVANAGADFSITLPTSTASISGSASTDADGTIASYAWSQSSGPSTATIASASSATTNVSGLKQGVYEFVLKVVDNSGATDLDSISITVNPAANQPPVANAGSSKSITLPTNSVSLSGSSSSDPDGSIASYAWTQTAGPSTSSITGASSVSATASNLVAGVYTFQLKVTDNSGASATANVKITVIASGSTQPPVANAGADQTITLPTNSVTISGSASTAASGNSITSYAWTEKSGPSTISLTNTAQNNLSNLVAGVYVFNLVVTDNKSATGKDSVIITVNPAANQAPVANAGSGVNLTLPTNSTTLDGTKSSDPDGTITTYKWTRISGPNTPSTNGSNSSKMTVSGMIAGQYTYQLTVTDNSGASSSAQVKIRVSSAANVAPVANAGSNQSITAPASTVSLNGTASADSDGSIASYSWVTVSGPGSVTINNSNTATPTVVGLQTGAYVFELTVTDNRGASSKDQVSITVLPAPIVPNQSPVANAGSDQTITLPTNSVTLSGKNSYDPDGTLVTYSWKQISGPTTSSIVPANISTTSATKLIEGQYVFELTVTDNNGATNADRITVKVNAAVSKLNVPPVASAGASDTISLPVSSYTLDATKSSDPDGTISSYLWTEVSGPNTVTGSAMNTSKASITNLSAGVYVFQVTVTDNAGGSSSATMTLMVTQGDAQSVTQVNRLSVYPNPAHSIVYQKVTSSITGKVQISVYDLNGKLVYTGQTTKTSDVLYASVNVSNLAPGMYTIQVNIANQKTLVSKFIKQ